MEYKYTNDHVVWPNAVVYSIRRIWVNGKIVWTR